MVRKARLKLLSYWLRFRWWVLVGGQVKRHPQHWLVWTAIMAVLTALGIAAAYSHPWPLRVLGVVFVALALYVLGSFFLPFKLPPLRDEDVVLQRREIASETVLKRLFEIDRRRASALAQDQADQASQGQHEA